MPKISDFGISQLVSEDDNNPIIYNEKISLPIRWTAPEDINSEFTQKNDIYSFGILMYEILSYGQVPFPNHINDSLVELLQTRNYYQIHNSVLGIDVANLLNLYKTSSYFSSLNNYSFFLNIHNYSFLDRYTDDQILIVLELVTFYKKFLDNLIINKDNRYNISEVEVELVKLGILKSRKIEKSDFSNFTKFIYNLRKIREIIKKETETQQKINNLEAKLNFSITSLESREKKLKAELTTATVELTEATQAKLKAIEDLNTQGIKMRNDEYKRVRGVSDFIKEHYGHEHKIIPLKHSEEVEEVEEVEDGEVEQFLLPTNRKIGEQRVYYKSADPSKSQKQKQYVPVQ